MFFDVQAALSDILASSPSTIATPATQLKNAAKVADVAALDPIISLAPVPHPPAAASPSPQDEPRPDAHGYCHTWTGRVVRLDEWRQLGASDRNGPDGRLFCGICHLWVNYAGGCGQAGCWKAEGGSA